MKKRYHIKVMGQDLSVVSDAEEEHVAQVVRYVNDKVEEIERQTKHFNSLNIAILTALNIADELFRKKVAEEARHRQLESRSERLIDMIEEAI
ncbi:MAG: cell division protein ZapA [Pseudomonadota bacterium]|nr:cell division protein ZapA [Pseudomonadota bacterium]